MWLTSASEPVRTQESGEQRETKRENSSDESGEAVWLTSASS